MKHLHTLERSGLVRTRKEGRVRTCELVTQVLTEAEQWLATQRTLWNVRADRMTQFTEQLHQEQTADDQGKSGADFH